MNHPKAVLLKRVPLCYFNKTFLFNCLFVVVLVFAAFHSKITSMFSKNLCFLCSFHLYSNQDVTRGSGNGFLRSSTPPPHLPSPPTHPQLSSMKIPLLRCSLIICRRCFHVLLLRMLCYSQCSATAGTPATSDYYWVYPKWNRTGPNLPTKD